MNDEVLPTNITADREAARLTIEWDDGKTCVYPFDLLRSACPCAQCRGGHENMKPEPDEDVFTIPLMSASATRMRAIEASGNYAINITWEDGHKYGIYNWGYLRALCAQMEDLEK
jgi:DUF971 family protein